MNLQQYELARQKITDKHKAALDADLASLDNIYSILREEPAGHSQPAKTQVVRETPAKRDGVAKGMVIDGAKKIFQENPDEEFSILKISEMLLANGVKTEKPSVSGAIIRLAKQGVIEITEQGVGRRPGKFRLKK